MSDRINSSNGGETMKLIKDHVIMISIIILTLAICPLLIGFSSNYSDYTYFINCVLSLVVTVSLGLKLFNKVRAENFIAIISCDTLLIIVVNELYSHNKLMKIKKDFNIHSEYMGLVEITALSIAILVIMKLIIWAREKDRATQGNMLENNARDENNGGVQNDGEDLGNNSTNHNSYVYMIVISIIAVLGLIGAIITVYIFRKPISEGTWVGFVPHLFVIIGVAIGVMILLNILTFFAKLIVDLIRYRDERQRLISSTIASYRLSITITFVLFILVYFFRDKFSLDSFINLVSDELGNLLALPLSFCLILAAFFVVVWLIQAILKVFSVPVDQYPSDKIKAIWDKAFTKAYEIAKKFFFIIIDTIDSAIEFAGFIPDYFQTLKILVLGEDGSDEENVKNSRCSETTSGENEGGEDV